MIQEVHVCAGTAREDFGAELADSCHGKFGVAVRSCMVPESERGRRPDPTRPLPPYDMSWMWQELDVDRQR